MLSAFGEFHETQMINSELTQKKYCQKNNFWLKRVQWSHDYLSIWLKNNLSKQRVYLKTKYLDANMNYIYTKLRDFKTGLFAAAYS